MMCPLLGYRKTNDDGFRTHARTHAHTHTHIHARARIVGKGRREKGLKEIEVRY